MVSAGDFKNGLTFEMDGNVMQVIEFQHVKPGKGAAFVRAKLKNVISGATLEQTFNPTAKFAAAAGDTALPAPMRAEARFAAGRLYAQQKQLDRAIALLSAAGSPEDMRSVTATWDEFSASLLRAINAGEYGPLKPAEPKL